MSEQDKYCCNPHVVAQDFYENILAFVITKVNDRELAKDLTQEVMGRMIDAYDRRLEIANVKAWLYKVSRNVIADRFRKKDYLNFVDADLESSEDENDFEISAENFIIPMIKLLPEEYSEPLYLSDIENLKQAEIAERLDLSLSAVKMRCKRARQKLHEMFLECCDIRYTESGAFAGCTIKSCCDVLIDEKNKFEKRCDS